MSTRQRYDVAVIGAGAFGAWTAYQLRQRGNKVALLDAYGPGHSRSSSGGETRIMRMGYGPDELYTRFALRSMRLWREFTRHSGQELFLRTGMLWLARKQDRYPQESLATLARLRVPCEKLSRAELGKRCPQFSLRGIDWGLLEPESGVLLARRAVQAVVAQAVEDGVEYIGEAVEVPRTGSRLDEIITNTGRRVAAGEFVFACGAWLPCIFPDTVGKRMFPSRQEVFFFSVAAGSSSYAPQSMPAWYSYADNIYGTPDIEKRGIKIGFDGHGPQFDPETADRIVSPRGLRAMREHLRTYFPELRDSPLSEIRVCAYENTSNGDFLIDRHPDIENLWIAGGGSGHGFKHAPAVGEYVAGLICEGVRAEPRFAYAAKATVQVRSVY
ncbi:MAG TPA: N-methyl-L-tryptophan oxidase [Terriglobales bacterium]|nr:N-methyl-L-tryptophan oxidase [Terriglobales bacterium]